MAKKANTPDPELWERQPKESARAFEAFALYRDMGADRSLRKVVQKVNKSLTTVGEWSTNNDWVKRAAAWDAEQDRIHRIKQQKDIQNMRKRHAGLATTMLVKAATALQQIPDDEIKASDISRMVEVASKLERISRGDVGEVVEERDGGKTADPVTFYMPDNGRDKPKEE